MGHGAARFSIAARRTVAEQLGQEGIARIVADLVGIAQDQRQAPSDRIAAARLLFAYAIGAPRPAPAAPIDVDLPAVRNAGDVPAAFSSLFDAVRAGTIDIDELEAVTRALGAAREALGEAELQRELSALRDQIENVKANGSGHHGWSIAERLGWDIMLRLRKSESGSFEPPTDAELRAIAEDFIRQHGDSGSVRWTIEKLRGERSA